MLGGAAAAAAPWLMRHARAAVPVTPAVTRPAPAVLPAGAPARVALTTGNDRADLAFQGLRRFEKEIAAAIGNKRIILKPNNVVITNQLAASHAQNLEGILEFLKSIGKKDVVIAESCAGGSTLEGFANYGYNKLAEKYGAKLVDLDQDEVDLLPCIDETDMRPRAVRMARLLTDPNNFIISAAKLKTHDTVVATLSLKNIVVGAPVKARFGNAMRSDKRLIHGGGFRGINYNLAALAPILHPHLAVIDGYEGMQGNGPVRGTPIDHRVCVVSTDWLAADRVGVALMGIDFAKVGYLRYCAQYGLGESDLARIEILGPAVDQHVKAYALADNIDQQLRWMTPAPR